MFKSKTPKPKTGLEEAIDRLHDDLKTVDPDTKQYAKMTKNLTALYKLRADDKSDAWPVSPDTVAIIAANLLGIAIIVGYEQKHVITSKAMTFVQKLH